MPGVTDIIRDRALANGVDPDLAIRFAQVESGLNPNAAAPTSSARGLFQFIAPTWKQYGKGGDPFDPAASADAGTRYLSDNQKTLQGAGLPVNAGSLYLAHFAGPGGAIKLLSASPDAPVGSVLGDAAVKANPFLRNMTVGGVRAWADSKMSGTVPAAASSGAGAGPLASPTAALAGSASPADGADGAGQDDELLAATIRALSASAAQPAQDALPIQAQPINFPAPPGLSHLRTLSRGMGRRI